MVRLRTPLAPGPALDDRCVELQDVVHASYLAGLGDSSDDEIQALQDALGCALDLIQDLCGIEIHELGYPESDTP